MKTAWKRVFIEIQQEQTIGGGGGGGQVGFARGYPRPRPPFPENCSDCTDDKKKNEDVWQSVLSSFFSFLGGKRVSDKAKKKKKRKKKRGYENIQTLSWWWVSFTESWRWVGGMETLAGFAHPPARLLVFCVVYRKKKTWPKKQNKKKKTRACVLHYCQDWNPGERAWKEAFLETQFINIRWSQTTQLLLHNCPIK